MFEIRTFAPTDSVFFYDRIQQGNPYIPEKPRNHESLFFITKGSLLYEKTGTREIITEGQVGYIARGSLDISAAYKCPYVAYITYCTFYHKRFYKKKPGDCRRKKL